MLYLMHASENILETSISELNILNKTAPIKATRPSLRLELSTSSLYETRQDN